MNSEDYRQILNNERIEMNAEDFDSTLTHFAKLYHKEQTQEIYKGLYSMKLLEFASIPDGLSKTYVKRVPGGWIFYNYNETQATFVPFNNEFQNAR